jgi:hypothetical protein
VRAARAIRKAAIMSRKTVRIKAQFPLVVRMSATDETGYGLTNYAMTNEVGTVMPKASL